MERKYEITESVTTTKNIFNQEDEKMVEHLLRKMLGIPENVELDDNLKDTPHRWCKLWAEMTEGYRTNPADYLNKMFPVNSENMADDAEKRHWLCPMNQRYRPILLNNVLLSTRLMRNGVSSVISVILP